MPENGQTKTQKQRRKWLAWLPAPILLAVIIAARISGLSGTFQSHPLLLILSFTFYTLVSLGTLYLIGRNFLASGSAGLLWIECGVILWSLAGTVGDAVSHGDANVNVTIFNTGILLSGLFHLAGAVFILKPQRPLRAKPLWLAAGILAALAALAMVTLAALKGWLPVFFIPGTGGTPVRFSVLISAIALFALSSILINSGKDRRESSFITWYTIALVLLAVGLFGVMIQLSLGSLVNWLGRSAQWLGGCYLLFAAIASLRESRLPLLPTDEKSAPKFTRYLLAVVIVLAATSIRLVFLPAMGTQAPFLIFYPAVILTVLYGGWRAGLLSIVLSALLADYFWLEPKYNLSLNTPADWLALIVFALSCLLIIWVTEGLRNARVRASTAETQALLAQANMERSKRLSDIGMLAATVAHELRNPLSAIRIANFNIVKKGHDDVKNNTATIDKKIADSTAIINNLLSFSKVGEYNLEDVKFIHVLAETVEHIRERYHLREDIIHLHFPEELDDLPIKADPLQLRELFSNILNNAVDAVSKEKGRIEITCAAAPGDKLDIRVTDNGCGIDQKNIAKLFEPFFTTKSKGTGLGLTVVKQIIENHKGQIRFENAKDGGTVVHITLPKDPAKG